MSLLGAVLLGSMVFLGALPESQAEDRTAIAVFSADGDCAVRAVHATTVARVEAALEEEAERLADMASRLMTDAAAARLAEARERVPAFGDWAYGWVQSYVTSYRVLGRVLRGLAAPAEGEKGLAARLVQEAAQPMREGFAERVLPADLTAGLEEDLRHAAILLEQAWRAALARAAAEFDATPPARGAQAVPRPDLAAAGHSVANDIATAAGDLVAVAEEDPSEALGALLRSARPMAGRAGAAVLRAGESGSAIAAAGALGYALGGLPGVLVGAAGGIGVSWTVDWGLSRLDAALHRDAFEAQALARLDAMEQQIAAQSARRVVDVLAQRRAALRPAMRGCGIERART